MKHTEQWFIFPPATSTAFYLAARRAFLSNVIHVRIPLTVSSVISLLVFAHVHVSPAAYLAD